MFHAFVTILVFGTNPPSPCDSGFLVPEVELAEVQVESIPCVILTMLHCLLFSHSTFTTWLIPTPWSHESCLLKPYHSHPKWWIWVMLPQAAPHTAAQHSVPSCHGHAYSVQPHTPWKTNLCVLTCQQRCHSTKRCHTWWGVLCIPLGQWGRASDLVIYPLITCTLSWGRSQNKT